jgi:CheY-like chemotaxis protein/HPt (histidine-containing phosphotransfer) domain-containing protein
VKTSSRKSVSNKTAHVLLVEDDPISLEVCVAILESIGCTVETATDGLHALDRHADSEFALIFMDCFMPEMDGYEATSQIRRREAYSRRRTPIVALTGDVTEGARERCLAAGMDDYLAKPFKLDQIRAMLTAWLRPTTHTVTREHLALVPGLLPNELMDYEVLDSLGQLQRKGRPDIVQEMINLFFKAATELLEDLKEGAVNRDAALLHHASHALQSASANVGAVRLSMRCKELGTMAQSGVVSDAAPIVASILDDYRAVEVALSDRLRKVA